MTCIVGLMDEERTVLASDSALTWWNDHQETTATKVFELGPNGQRFLYGGAGSVRVMDVVRAVLDVEPMNERRGDLLELWIRKQFVDTVRAACRKAGCLETKDGVERIDGRMLIGLEGALFTVWSDLSIVEATAFGAAIGSGARPAIGSLYSTHGDLLRAAGVDEPLSLQDRAELALEAAAACTSSVRKPFQFLEIERPSS